MLKITVMMVGQVPYVVKDVSIDDYLSQGGESLGIYMGTGTTCLDLVGPVDGVTLTNLLNGMSPDGSRALIQHRAIGKDKQHAAGWQLTFNAPKSVSILGALGDPWTSRQVEEAHQAALVATVAYIEEHYAYTRRGSGGQRLERCFIVVANHTHFTSRSAECHLHSHLSLPNVACRHDGTTGTLVSKVLYDHQLELGAYYRMALGVGLIQRLGVKLETVKLDKGQESFRIVGVPQELEISLSSRHEEILAEVKRRGTSGAAAREDAALATRKPKQNITLEVLTDRWRRLGESKGFGEAQIRALVKPHGYREDLSPSQSQPQPSPAKSQPEYKLAKGVANSASPSEKKIPIAKIQKSDRPAIRSTNETSESQGVRDFREYVRNQQPGSGPAKANQPVSSSMDTGALPETLQESNINRVALKRLLVAAAQANVPKDAIYRLIDHLLDKATRSALDRAQYERALGTPREREDRLVTIVQEAESAAQDHRHHLAPGYVSRQFIKVGGQGEEFLNAVTEIMSNRGAAAVVQTGPGVEGEDFLSILRDIYQKAGYSVVGVATTGTAAAAMEAATGIPTHCAAQFIYRVAPTTGQLASHYASQLKNLLWDMPTQKFDRWSLNHKSVVVVYDAQNLDSIEVQTLQGAASAANAKILYVGDHQQYKAREPGNAFESLKERLGAVKLADAPRPVEHWAQDAVSQLTRGDVNGALSQYALAARLHLTDEYAQAAAKLIRQWIFIPQEQRGSDTLIIARNADEARVLNRAAQHARKERGELGCILKQRIDGTWVRRNDRMRFTASSPTLGYRNGDQGVIERIGLDTVTVRLDRTKQFLGFDRPVTVQIPRIRYGDLTLGYALDAYTAQNISLKMAFVLTDANPMNLSAMRTQISRATDETRVFATRHCVDEEVEQIHDLVQFDLKQAQLNQPLEHHFNHHPIVRFFEERFPRTESQNIQKAPMLQNGSESQNSQKVENDDVADHDRKESQNHSIGPSMKP